MCQLKQCEASLEWAPGELWVKLEYTWYLHKYTPTAKPFIKFLHPQWLISQELTQVSPNWRVPIPTTEYLWLKLTGTYRVPLVTGNGKSWIVRASFDVCLQGLDFEMIALPTFWTFWGFAMPAIRVRSSQYFLFSKVNTLMHISSNRVKCITFSCLQSVKIINKYSPTHKLSTYA